MMIEVNRALPHLPLHLTPGWPQGSLNMAPC